MSLKELTKEKHTAAESTPFMKAVFKKKMPISVWRQFTFQKHAFYKIIESKCRRKSLLGGIEGIERGLLLYEDYISMPKTGPLFITESTKAYMAYLDKLDDPDRLLAHLYVWHMGDLFGGQMIKEIVDAPSSALNFDNPDELKAGMRLKLKDEMADEANAAFDWAIKIMTDFDDQLTVQ